MTSCHHDYGGAVNKHTNTPRSAVRGWRKAGAVALLLAWSLGAGMVSARVLSDEVQQALEQQDNAHVQQPGFVEVELDAALWERHYRLLDDWLSKSGQSSASATATLPDSDMGPIERAMRLIEAREGKLPRVRYHIEYRRVALPALDDWEPRAQLQISRFNLGPVLRRELLAALGAENVAAPEEFGIGPHVRWRFVIGPAQGMKAEIWRSARQLLGAAEAEAADCLGIPCLSTDLVAGPTSGWQELEQPPQFAPPLAGEFADAAAAAGIVAAAGLGPDNLGYGEMVETASPTAPQLVLLVSEGLGADPALEVLALQPAVMDDAIAQLWLRRVEMAPGVSWSQLPIYRPGRQ